MDALKKLMDKKKSKDGEMDPMKKKAKIDLLEELREMATGMMKDDLMGHKEGLKKVTVASDSEEGLKEGLEKAEEVLEAKESDEGEEEESEDNEDLQSMSREELLAKLMQMKRQ